MPDNVWFWTSVSPALFQRSLFRAMAERGIHVRPGFSISASDFRKPRGAIGQVLLRFRMYVEHPLRLGWAVLMGDASDVHIVTTNPFIAPWVAILASRGQGRVIHLVYDLFPDAAVVAGKVSDRSPLAGIVRRIVRTIFDSATANVFIGRWLVRHAENSFGPIPRTAVIPVGADAKQFAAHPPTRPPRGTPVDILYSGALGNMHDVDTLIGAIGRVEQRGARVAATVTFHAFGPSYGAFSQRVRSMPSVGSMVRLESALPDDQWVTRMRAAHVALVTMKADAERIVMPSKTYSALAAGQAILAVCNQGSDLADLVVSHDCGWVVTPGDEEGLVRALDELTTNPDALQRKRENAYRVGQNQYSEDAMAGLWSDLLGRVGGGGKHG